MLALVLAAICLESAAAEDMPEIEIVASDPIVDFIEFCGQVDDCEACLGIELTQSTKKKSDCGWFVGEKESICLPKKECKNKKIEPGKCTLGKRGDDKANKRKCKPKRLELPPDVCSSNGDCKECLDSKYGDDCVWKKIPGPSDGKAMSCMAKDDCPTIAATSFRGICNEPVDNSPNKKTCRLIENGKLSPLRGPKSCFPELVGLSAAYASFLVEYTYKGVNIVVVRPGDTCCTKDLRKDRLRLFVDEIDFVTDVPCFG